MAKTEMMASGRAEGGKLAALEVRRLSAGYPGNRHALDDINFSVDAGERVAIIGPNGAGKSTLFKAIVGVLHFTQGAISIYGEDCHSSHSNVVLCAAAKRDRLVLSGFSI